MNRYICTKCSLFCYSAATPETMRDDHCPYHGCDGHVVLAPEEPPAERKHFEEAQYVQEIERLRGLITSNLREGPL